MSDFEVSLRDGIAHLQLNRPEVGNALSAEIWNGLPAAISDLDRSGEVRALIVSANGKMFCSGMDLAEFETGIPAPDSPAARESFYHLAVSLQETFTCFERARFPIVAVVNGACLGAGLELVAACDLRIATEDAFFRIEEINVGIMADVGALQRLPKLLPDQIMRRMAYLGAPLGAHEAMSAGFVSQVAPSKEDAMEAAMHIAKRIQSKAAVAIAGTKAALRWSRDHSVPDALEWSARTQSALWSMRDIRSSLENFRGTAGTSHESLHPIRPIGKSAKDGL
ncbi:MAG: enoyl-CoA hydratase-related protein [Hyphomonadaceae bacterium]|nr:enoyl-CoA hydratase-related protein [Hyphomonadaceae bacterium]